MAYTPENPNLAQAAFRAGVNTSQKRQIDGLAAWKILPLSRS